MQLRAQGATEYLVLLAVVLIVALVSIALLGFFPGMASDAQETQSKTYWSSASPIAITEWGAMSYSASVLTNYAMPYLRLKNNGAYPIRITKLLGGDGRYMHQFYDSASSCPGGGSCNLSDFLYLAPGETGYLADRMDGGRTHWNVPSTRFFGFLPTALGGASGGYYLYAASATCSPSPPYGAVVVKNFGFEYIQYIEGQQITKRQIGSKDLVIKCSQPPA